MVQRKTRASHKTTTIILIRRYYSLFLIGFLYADGRQSRKRIIYYKRVFYFAPLKQLTFSLLSDANKVDRENPQWRNTKKRH